MARYGEARTEMAGQASCLRSSVIEIILKETSNVTISSSFIPGSNRGKINYN